jgi:hypothetical protein
MMILALLTVFLTFNASAEVPPPLCSRQGFYFLGSYGKSQRAVINSQWSPSKDPHFSRVYLSCSGKAAKICKKSAGRLSLTVRSHRTQLSSLVVEQSEKNMVSFRAKKLDFMSFFPSRVLEGSEAILYVGTATRAFCQHPIEIIP